MTRHEFENELAQYGMIAKFYTDGKVEIGKKEFANPLIFFNQENRGKKYGGEVTVKAINLSLFSPTQITISLFLCNQFLKTVN